MAPRPKHGTSRSRRRTRRSEERAAVVAAATDERLVPNTDFNLPPSLEDLNDAVAAVATLVAGASGSTSLPLSDQGDAWDAGAAAKGLSDAQLPNAFFWKDPDGDPKAKSSYKLGFAEDRSGTLTAVWRGVTAAAGAVQGARGGVQIPSGDVAGVKAKIGSYYSKAAKQYDDDNIKPPWAKSEGQSDAFLLAYAECSGLGLDQQFAEGPDGEEILVGVGGSGEAMDQFLAVLAYWQEQLGGAPSKGTDADRRLKRNTKAVKNPRPGADDGDSPSSERVALDHVRDVLSFGEAGELADTGECAECGHAFSNHEGTDGACGVDGCTCDGYVAAASAAADSDPLARIVVMNGDRFVVRIEGELDEVTTQRLTAHLENFEVEAPTHPAPVEVLPKPNGGEPEITPPANPTGELRWTANMVPEATLTDDGRAMAPGSISWRELPLTLMAMTETSEGGHVGAEVAGRIDEIYRGAPDEHGKVMIKGSGVFAQTEYGALIASLAVGEPVDPELLARVQAVVAVDSEGAVVASLVADQTLRGISVDLAIAQYEVGPKSDYFDEDGNWLTEKPVKEEAEPEEEPSLIDLLFGGDEDSIFVVTEAVIGAVTVCPFQAFADANISMAASGSPAVWTVRQQHGMTVTRSAVVPGEEPETPQEALTASAAGLAPEAPPVEWFDDPEFEELTGLTVTDDGRIFGHAAAWDTCHIGIPGVCTTAPQTETNYAYFLLKEVVCDDGARVPCGTITLETGHADRSLGRNDATAHYDNTGLAVADVNVGEDEFGIWVAGALRADVDSEKARELRGAVLSGDWRNVNGNLELVALLAVNVPGFPVPRARALVAAAEDGEQEVIALVAAGITIGELHQEDDRQIFTDVQLEKIRAHAHVASGRLAALAARAAAQEGIRTADEVREDAGLTADGETEEEPAPLAPESHQPPATEGDEPEPIDDDPDQDESE